VPNAKAAISRIEKLTGLRFSESQCRRAVRQMGMSLKRPQRCRARSMSGASITLVMDNARYQRCAPLSAKAAELDIQRKSF